MANGTDDILNFIIAALDCLAALAKGIKKMRTILKKKIKKVKPI